MSILGDPIDWEEPEHTGTSEPYLPFRTQRPSNRISSGSLRCPTCDVPIVIAAAMPLAGRMRCPFCRLIHPVRGFVQIDAHDTPLNAIELRAKLPL